MYKISPQTDSSDYMLEETLLTFPPGSNSSSRLCTTLTTLPDAIEEGNETVVVHVVPVAPDTTPGGEQRSLTVTIINNDGMLTFAERKHYSCLLFLGTYFKMYSTAIVYMSFRCKCLDMLVMIIMMILSLTVNCPALPIPSYPLLVDASSGLNEGAAIIYSCAPGYKLDGDRQRNCVNGIWTGREPTCTGNTCTPRKLSCNHFKRDYF